MRKVKYTVLYETGNSFEPVDYYDDFLEVSDDMSNEDIKTALYDEINCSKAWIGGWEVL